MLIPCQSSEHFQTENILAEHGIMSTFSLQTELWCCTGLLNWLPDALAPFQQSVGSSFISHDCPLSFFSMANGDVSSEILAVTHHGRWIPCFEWGTVTETQMSKKLHGFLSNSVSCFGKSSWFSHQLSQRFLLNHIGVGLYVSASKQYGNPPCKDPRHSSFSFHELLVTA